jgi:hypothetical protein
LASLLRVDGSDNPEFKDMVKPGIIDPTKVGRSALQHTASFGSLIDHRGGDGRRAAEVIRCRQWIFQLYL